MLTTDQAQQLLSGSGNVVDTDGDKIGSIGQVFLDDQTGQPEWVTTKTGMFGGAESFVPLRNADLSGDDVQVPYDKAKVKNAPRIEDSEGHLSQDEERELYAYYDVDGGYNTYDREEGVDQGGLDQGVGDHHVDSDSRSGPDQDANALSAGAGHDTSGPDTDSTMTLSEEQLRVGTQTREAGRVRLRKYIVTENVTKTVPVRREEVRLEREPITDSNRSDATAGGELTEEDHEVVLHEERVVVDLETVPVERVRVDKETVTEQEHVDETLRKERMELDDQTDGTQGTDRGGERRDG